MRTTTHARKVAAAPSQAPEPARPMLSRSAARDRFAELANRVTYGRERIVVGNRGNAKNAVAMISMTDLRLLELMEDEMDLRGARAAIEAHGDAAEIPWETVKKKLGL